MSRTFRVGTRGSALALTQTNWVVEQLRIAHPEAAFIVEVIKTTGDMDHKTPLPAMGGRGVFVKEVEEALLSNHVDLAVHSMKDLPAQMPSGLQISAVPLREDPRDCLISKTGASLAELPPGSRIGTGSPRRRAQLAQHRPDLYFAELRGNVDTRLGRVAAGEYDAIVLAMAGLSRLGRASGTPIPVEICLPAVGQGALAVQTRSDDTQTIALLSVINDACTQQAVLAERTVLSELGGGCHTPIAAYGRVIGKEMQLIGVVAAVSGQQVLRVIQTGTADAPETLGRLVAKALLGAGAAELT